jgi:uncharacterized protein with GYD domain
MPTYVALFKWTEQGVRTVKETVARTEQNRSAIEKAGGRLVGVWWTQGAYDVVAVTEFPDDETASAVMLSINIAGSVRTETMRAYTVEEMQGVLQKLP